MKDRLARGARLTAARATPYNSGAARRQLWRATLLLTALGAAGCPDPDRHPASVAPPASMAEVVESPAESSSQLEAWALDPALPVERRYAALRRLEELAPPSAVAVAQQLVTSDNQLLRVNALGVLVPRRPPRRRARARFSPGRRGRPGDRTRA